MNCKENTVQFVQMSSKIWVMPKKPVVNLARLEELMLKKKWKIGELAHYSGVKYDTVYSLVMGRRPNSNIATLKALADALEVSTDYLLGESDDSSPPAGTMPGALRELLRIAGDLSVMRQEELVKIAVALAALERERATHMVSEESMRALLAAANKLEGQIEGKELLAALQVLARELPAGWIVDLQPGQDAPDQPAQGE